MSNNWNQWPPHQNPNQNPNQNPEQQGYRNHPHHGMPPMPRQQRMGGGGGGGNQHQDYYGARAPQQNFWQPAHPHQMHPQQQQQWRRNQENHYRQQQQQQQHQHPHHQLQQQQIHHQPHHQQHIPQQQIQQQQAHQPPQFNTMMSHPSPNAPFVFNANANVFVPRSAMQAPVVEYGMQSPGQPVFFPMQQGFPQQGYGPQAASSSSYNNMQQQPDDPRSNQAIDAFAHFGQQFQQYMPSTELYQLMQTTKSPAFISEIQVGCEQLIMDVNDTMGWADAICYRFRDPEMDDQSKRVAVKLIVEMAFSMEPNGNMDPQNIFSNLLSNLSNQMRDFLRHSIVPVLGEYHNNRNVLENDFRVNLAVFYAECYVKLTLDNGSRFEKIGEALCDQIDEILKFPKQDSYIRCLVRVFMVAGAEMDVSENLRKRIDQILTIMGGFAKGSPHLGDEVKDNVFKLIECRTRGWDRRVGAARSRFQPAPESFDESADADLTEEQLEFLEKQMNSLPRKESNEDIDEEVEKEFGKFVSEEFQAIEDAKAAEMMAGLNVNDAEPDASAESEQKPSEPSE